MNDDRRGRLGLIILLLPVLALVFWFTAVQTSNLPGTFVVGVNVHGLTLNPFAPESAQRPAPLALSALADAQQDATSGNSSSSGAGPGGPSPIIAGPTPRSTPVGATATAKPTPSPSSIALPTPSLTPLPTPTLPTPSASPTSGSATIAGQVVDSQTHLPIVGATVSLSPGGASTTTDVNGSFSFSVAPGTYTVTASAPTYNPAGQSVAVRGGQKVTLSFKLVNVTAYGSLTGSVIDSTTQGPIVGATVTLSNGLARVTDTNGAFSFSIVLNGTYTMTVSAVGYLTQTQSVTIRAGKTTNVQVALGP